MSNEIRIQKTTILLVLGLLVAVVAGAYVINSASAPAQAAQDSGLGQDALPGPVLQAQASGGGGQAAPRIGGCGCGGGGLTCGAGAQAAAPDPSKVVLLNSSDSSVQGAVQDIYIRAKNDGTYDKAEVTVKAGLPVRLHFTADPDAGCGRQFVIYGLNIRAVSTNGEENVVEFIPQQAGTYEYNCGMRMWQAGTLVVV